VGGGFHRRPERRNRGVSASSCLLVSSVLLVALRVFLLRLLAGLVPAALLILFPRLILLALPGLRSRLLIALILSIVSHGLCSP
jgi:hypothetical protein